MWLNKNNNTECCLQVITVCVCVCKILCACDDKYKKDNCVDDWEFTIEALEKNTNMSPLKFDEIWFVSIRKEEKFKKW